MPRASPIDNPLLIRPAADGAGPITSVTLRDLFASRIAGALAQVRTDLIKTPEHIAVAAYDLADSLLIERARRK